MTQITHGPAVARQIVAEFCMRSIGSCVHDPDNHDAVLPPQAVPLSFDVFQRMYLSRAHLNLIVTTLRPFAHKGEHAKWSTLVWVSFRLMLIALS